MPTTLDQPAASQGVVSDLEILTSLPVILWAADVELRLCPPIIATPIEVTAPTLLERPIATLFRDCARSAMAHHRSALAGSAVQFNFEQDGRTYEARVTPRRDASGEIVGVLGIALDVSERVMQDRIQRHTRDLELMGQVAGSMAHDFNNLLTIISSYAQFLIERFDEDEESYEDVQVIQDATRRAGLLVRQLLTFGGRQLARPERVDINALAQRIANAHHETLPPEIDFVVELHNDPCTVNAGADALEQGLDAIVRNAREAMPQGGTLLVEVNTIDLSYEVATVWLGVQPGLHVSVAISDTGRGMTKEVQERLFEPFFTTKSQRKGAGLGASTAYGVFRQCDAGLWVHSLPNIGTTFWLFLPHAEPGSQATKHQSATPNRNAKTATILLIDGGDQCTGQALVALRSRGHKVVIAHDWEDAIALIDARREQLDLVVAEALTSQFNSALFYRKARSLCPALQFLWISGYTAKLLAALGMPILEDTPLLTKPFDSNHLLKLVANVLAA